MRSEYVYDLSILDKTLENATKEANNNSITLHYAMKANSNDEILDKVSKKINVDCVSQEEINKALEFWKAKQIVFAGSGKKRSEINYALEKNIFALHIESVNEFLYAKEIKKKLKSKTHLVLRANININVNTHRKISTGKTEHKFGIDMPEVIKLIKQYSKEIYGLHCHAGSQILDSNWFGIYANTVKSYLSKLHNFKLNYLNLGGGLGIDYKNVETLPDFKSWMFKIRQFIPKTMVKDLRLEPGRSIVGQCGKIHTQVQWIKNENSNNPYVILDVGMSDILRPALYDSYHKITGGSNFGESITYKIFGPSCESSDVFGEYILNKLKEEDFVTIHSTGAYVESMKLDYNLRKKLPTRYEHI